MKTQKRKTAQHGFSVMETLMVVFILSIVLGALFKQIERAQTRYLAEDQKLDLTQQDREFIDQMTRDLHQAGFPSIAQYANQYGLNSKWIAAGVWYISQTDLQMEGDVSGSGVVQSISYHYDDGSSWTGAASLNPCPCLRRSEIPKTDAAWPWAQGTPIYYTEVQNVISVTGQPIFSAYLADGTLVDLSTPVVLGSGTTVTPTAQTLLQSIKTVRITLTVQGKLKDPDMRNSVQVTMTGMARLPNN